MKSIKVKHMLSLVYGDAIVKLDGNLTPEVRRLFTSGQCHALAAALNEILGWKIGVCIDAKGRETHFVVESPTGKFADANGLHDTAPGVRGEYCDWDYVLHCYRKYGFAKPNMVFARHFAPIIAKELESDGVAEMRGQ
jgi:hypothetical protein